MKPLPVFVPVLCSQGDLSFFLYGIHLESDTGGVSVLGIPALLSSPSHDSQNGVRRTGILKIMELKAEMFRKAGYKNPAAVSWYLCSLWCIHGVSGSLCHGCSLSLGLSLSPPGVQPAGMAQVEAGQLQREEPRGVLGSLAAALEPRLLLQAPLFAQKFPFGSSAFTGLQFQAGLRSLLFISHLGILCWQRRWKGCG